MDKKTKLAWLKRYSETNAVSGFEAPMKELLQEFLSYMEDARTKFVSRDQEGASAIRGC